MIVSVTVGGNNGVDRIRMDKSKGRTDLLAAGRKKFQQFRQKKDSKGGSGHGKSSKKSVKAGKHEPDAEEAPGGPMSTTSSQVTDGNVESNADSNFCIKEVSESESLAESFTLDFSAPSVNSSSATDNDTGVQLQLATTTELALQAQVVDEHDSAMLVQNEEESIKDVGIDMLEDVPLGTFHGPVSEDGTTLDHMPSPVDTLPVPAPVTTAAGKSSRVERECRDAEESLLLSEDIPNTSESVKNGGESTQDVGTEMVKGVTMDDHMPTTVDIMSVPAPVTSTADKAFSVEIEGEDKQESLHVYDDIPSTSLTKVMEDQGQCRKLMVWIRSNLVKAVIWRLIAKRISLCLRLVRMHSLFQDLLWTTIE